MYVLYTHGLYSLDETFQPQRDCVTRFFTPFFPLKRAFRISPLIFALNRCIYGLELVKIFKFLSDGPIPGASCLYCMYSTVSIVMFYIRLHESQRVACTVSIVNAKIKNTFESLLSPESDTPCAPYPPPALPPSDSCTSTMCPSISWHTAGSSKFSLKDCC
jgi:hypothetical protein